MFPSEPISVIVQEGKNVNVGKKGLFNSKQKFASNFEIVSGHNCCKCTVIGQAAEVKIL